MSPSIHNHQYEARAGLQALDCLIDVVEQSEHLVQAGDLEDDVFLAVDQDDLATAVLDFLEEFDERPDARGGEDAAGGRR